MAVPDFQSMFLPMLRLAADGSEHSLADLRKQLQSAFSLSEADLIERLPSGQSRFVNRVSWAAVYLARAGMVERVRRGIFQITATGRVLLDRNPDRITIRTLADAPGMVEFRQGMTEQSPAAAQTEKESVLTPEEQLASSYHLLRQSLADDLLEAAKKSSPAFFEQLVVDLLVAMGYGGSMKDAGQAVGRSGDGGVDGVIKEDQLGLEVIYVQAKRWEGTVGRPVVQGFAGSLEGHRARKGVLITTSEFSREALDYVQRIERKIVLIDGKRLAELMIDHGVAVRTENTYTVKRMDQEYFDDN
jgi:restriction system protein